MRTVDLFDNYLAGNLDGADLLEFEQRLENDSTFKKAFQEHKLLLDLLTEHNEKNVLKNKLSQIHTVHFGKEAKIISINNSEKLTKRLGKTFAVAASAAVVAVVVTIALLSTGGYLLKKQKSEITDLKREVDGLKYYQDAIVQKLKTKGAKANVVDANLEGTGFAINNNGYVLTSWHMVNGADSIFIENNNTERTQTKIIFNDPALDIAVLKIENTNVSKDWQVPYTLFPKTIDVGDNVFTLGYPRQDVVYGEGSLSSQSGYYNDTAMYQISIPVNPGNSGGPLLDIHGNVIGVIRGKISGAEGTGFAIKSREIIKSFTSIDGDSTTIDFVTPKKNALKNLKRSEQLKRINPYVFNVMVYKSN